MQANAQEREKKGKNGGQQQQNISNGVRRLLSWKI
jgi:hypothetical protein